MRVRSLIVLGLASLFGNCSYSQNVDKKAPAMEEGKKNEVYSRSDTSKVNLDNAEWKKVLPSEVYHIAREKGTEWAFTGKYWNTKDKGVYACVCCGQPLFSSDTKFDSGTGWPSFYKPLNEGAVETETDSSYGMVRTEARCAKCDAHLGHVFEGERFTPKNTRHCVNSISMDFIPE